MKIKLSRLSFPLQLLGFHVFSTLQIIVVKKIIIRYIENLYIYMIKYSVKPNDCNEEH